MRRTRFKAAAARIRGAKRCPAPGFIEPSLASLRAEAPRGDRWIFEIKLDGYRAQAHAASGESIIYTRRGYDWTDRFALIAEAIAELPVREAILDGEVVVLNEAGLSDFPRLQLDLAQGRTDRQIFYAFDLLYLDGFDLRLVALSERKQLLQQVLRQAPEDRLRYSDHLHVEGAAVFERACAMHLEGIVAKRTDAPYRSGRNDSWIKVKCHKSADFPVVAFVEKLGAHPRRIASLYLGRYEGERLLYAGKAQTGFTEPMLRELREQLAPFIRKTSPLSVAVKKPKATWVEPVLRVEVQYSSMTSDGVLREAVFKGIRDDLSAPPRPMPKARRRATAVPKENILQLLSDAVVPTKEQLRAYWRRVVGKALPYLARRPLKLVRSVAGTTFYHMGPLPPTAPGVHELQIQKREGGAGTRLWIDDLEGLLGLVDMDVIEVHPWNAVVDDIERADTLVIDLDPGTGIEWEFVVSSALALRDLLAADGYTSWPKLTGGKGIHVMAPVQSAMTHDQTHRYCKQVAQRLARTDPKRYTIQANLPARHGRLFIDYLRNGRGTTAVGTYSPRARAGFPIAAPATWEQIEQRVQPDAYTLAHPLRAARRS